MNSPAVWSDVTGNPSGPLVVVIHGSMDRSAGMLKVARQLDDRAHVLRYDRRGYGRSCPHDGPYGMQQQVDDLAALLADRAAVLVGHSYGGNVALATAARHPHLVRAVSIYESPLSWEPWWPGTTAGANALATRGEPADAAEAFMRRLVGDVRWEALPERTRQQRRLEGAAMVGELSDLREHAPWRAEQLWVPVLAGYGSKGRPHHRRGMEHVAATVAGAQAVSLEGCGHDAPMTHPALYAETLVVPLLG